MKQEVTLQLPRRKVEYEDALLGIIRQSGWAGTRLDGDDRRLLKELCDALMGVS